MAEAVGHTTSGFPSSTIAAAAASTAAHTTSVRHVQRQLAILHRDHDLLLPFSRREGDRADRRRQVRVVGRLLIFLCWSPETA